jgi:DNA-directed RNA polymerase alpha subunit
MAKKIPQSAPKPGETTDMDAYEPFDAEWRKIGLSAPSRRALVDAKLYKVSDLRKVTSDELDQLHGLGKSSIARIKVIMHGKRIQFRL